MVIVDVTRGGPGLGSIAPEQADYFQMVKGGGHGCYHMVTYAPNSAQEMCDLTMKSFEVADKYRNPTIVLADGLVGQMKEPVHLPQAVRELPIDSRLQICIEASDRENQPMEFEAILLHKLSHENESLHGYGCSIEVMTCQED